MLKTTAMVILNQIYATQNWCVLALHDMIYLKPDWAMELAKNNKPSVRYALAQNLHALSKLPEVVEVLSQDPDYLVRCHLAYNHSALANLPEIVMALSQDPDYLVRCHLAYNHSALANLPEIVMALSQDPDYLVRSCLASNPAIVEARRSAARGDKEKAKG